MHAAWLKVARKAALRLHKRPTPRGTEQRLRLHKFRRTLSNRAEFLRNGSAPETAVAPHLSAQAKARRLSYVNWLSRPCAGYDHPMSGKDRQSIFISMRISERLPMGEPLAD